MTQFTRPLTKISAFVIVAGLWLSLAAGQVALADNPETQKQDDGPHVLWQDDTTAIVFYYCNKEIVHKTFVVHDTLRFNGFCFDSDAEYVVPVIISEPGPYEVEGVSKVMAISDIHGDYEHFAEILVNFGVIDKSTNWTWDNGHLVICGDVFDRGDHVTECLWLIYRLEKQAALAGGAVHYLMGNHELMVLRGDLRYVHKKYMKGIGHRKRAKYDDLFGPDTEFGRWLRTKHAVMRVNDIAYLHGGLSPSVMQFGFDIGEINELARSALDLSGPRLLFSDTAQWLFGGHGPFWYRGYHYEMEDQYPATTTQQIDSVLDYFDIDRIVVGHTQQDSVSVLHDGRVIAIDVRVEDIGSQQALLWQDGRLYRVYGSGDLKLIE